MKLILHPNSQILVIGHPAKIATWAKMYPGQVLGMSPEAGDTGCRIIRISEDYEEIVDPIPCFSAVVFDSTDDEYHSWHWINDKKKEWMGRACVRGGYSIFYGMAPTMPDAAWSWDLRAYESLQFGPTNIRIGTQLVCCALGKVRWSQEEVEPAFCDLPWYDDMQIALPPARREAFTFDRSEYTDEEIEQLANTDTSLIDLAYHGYKVTGIESPPLELGVGHLGLLIASGQLAGRIETPGEPPHVMRGISRKVERQGRDHQGRDTVTEQVEIIVRTVDNMGRILEYTA